MITRTGMNEGVTLCFSLALCREIQWNYENKGLERAVACMVNKGFQGDISLDWNSCKRAVERIATEDILQGNGRWWFQLQA